MLKKPEVSIIIVKYNCEDFLKKCLTSIGNNPLFEVIIVDNDKDNVGFGAGCNKGAKNAKGEYLFFLNPDTFILENAIEILVNFLRTTKEAGVVAPLLLDKNQNPYPLQGSRKLTPLTALIVFSFLNKYFPNNFISRRFFLKDWNKKSIYEVDVVPGSALLIRKSIFEEIGGFDEKFFLFFEEFDLCKRIREKGWKIFINSDGKVIHYWKKSTPKSEKNKKIFYQSRFYYFKKHWGFPIAFFLELFLRSSEWLAQKF